MSNANVQIAVEYVEQMTAFTKPGGTVLAPNFPGNTKHDRKLIQNGLLKLSCAKSVMVDKKVIVLTLK